MKTKPRGILSLSILLQICFEVKSMEAIDFMMCLIC